MHRQIGAFDEIAAELSELQIYCSRQLSRENEHWVPYNELPKKSPFQRAVHLQEIAHKQQVFISRAIFDRIYDLCQRVFMLGSAEMAEDEVGPVRADHYDGIRLAAKIIIEAMREELFADQPDDKNLSLHVTKRAEDEE